MTVSLGDKCPTNASHRYELQRKATESEARAPTFRLPTFGHPNFRVMNSRVTKSHTYGIKYRKNIEMCPLLSCPLSKIQNKLSK